MAAIDLHLRKFPYDAAVGFLHRSSPMKISFSPPGSGTGLAGPPGDLAQGGRPPAQNSRDPQSHSANLVTLVIGTIVALVAVATLIGWWLDVGFLKSVNSGWVTMKPNSAFGFLLGSVALVLLARPPVGKLPGKIAAALALATMALGAATLLQYVFALDLGIDVMLFHGAARMSPSSALCLFLAGSALLVASAQEPRRYRLPVLQALSLSIVIAGLFAITGYISDLVQRFRLWSYTGMAMHEALLFVLLGAGMFALSQVERPTVWSLNRRTTAGFVAGIVLMLGAVNVSFQFIGDMQRTAQSVAHRQEVLREIQEVHSGLTSLESGRRGYIITGNQSLLWDRGRTRAAVRGDIGDIRALTAGDTDQQERLDQLEKLVAERMGWEEQTISARRNQGFPAAAAMTATGGGSKSWDAIRVLLSRMSRQEYAQLDADSEKATAAATMNYLLLPMGVFLSIVILLLCLFFLNAGTGERRQIEFSLRESELRYRDLVEMSPNAIWVHNGDRISYINTAGLRLLHAEGALQVVGRPVLDFFHPDCHAIIRLRIAQLLRRPQVVPLIEEKLLTLDGISVPVEVTAVSFVENGRMVIQVNGRDISARKEAEEKLRRMHSELEQRVAHRTAELRTANEELDSFCYAVSHDLRAPLRGIAGFTRILSESYCGDLEGEARDYFDRVIAATDRMGELIDDLLHLSRVSREDFHREPVDMSLIARAIADDLGSRSPERRVEFVIEPGMVTEGDPRLLRILLENLLGNAWKFTSKKPDARIEFAAKVANGVREFCVRDNGAGFDMRYAERLFGPFQRLHGVKEFPGTGIGLATVQRIVHRHGGDIRAEATVDAGAAFTFTI
jgi:PAS domain S-box-containing protein